MSIESLRPTIDHLAHEAVLVQAWKKASAYIRYHNWFSDTLELDRVSINLPDFIAELSREISSRQFLRSSPLRLVPAPKSQHWRINKNGAWGPLKESKTTSKIRPLAHVNLKDQVVATAIMLCLADRVETAQADPRTRLDSIHLKKVTSYGNRLFCDVHAGGLKHRWGSSKLYRSFYQDYQSFLSRPETIAEKLTAPNTRPVILYSDLRQFYDRVTPELLSERVKALREPEDDDAFFHFFERFMDWRWAEQDIEEVKIYSDAAGLTDFKRISLPQGLVASGFFANVVLLPFDEELRKHAGEAVFPNIKIVDSVRYVDDLRVVVSVTPDSRIETVECDLLRWLTELLQSKAPGLAPAEDKTRASVFRGDERPLVQQSRRMGRIQTAISGGFDVIAGGDILDSVLALVRSQQLLAKEDDVDAKQPFLPIPDVRDATVDRFAAGRFRTTYRSLRPLLWLDREEEASEEGDDCLSQFRGTRTRAELDDEARAFALNLIAKWVDDPSNVRLLRIGLDLWPAADVLQKVLDLLKPFTERGRRGKEAHRIAWYCLSEILRAGATETGFVEDTEALPQQLDLDAYRKVLRVEAWRLIAQTNVKLPWYLKQQALLFLATNSPVSVQALGRSRHPETKYYIEFIRFLSGASGEITTKDYATYAISARRSFVGRAQAISLIRDGITPARMDRIAALDPNFGREIIEAFPRHTRDMNLNRPGFAGGSNS